MFNKLILVAISITLSVVVVEGLARIVLNPIDLLQPTTERDPLLNHRIAPHTGGHDDRGFRNSEALDHADIVTIGDSMTYGVAATLKMSWPQQLAALQKTDIYNMSLGGYGPLHYLHLIKVAADELSPTIVVVGIYLGNDLMDAYNLVYSNPKWSKYRNPNFVESVNPDDLVSIAEETKKMFGDLRNFLSRNSVIYSVLTRSLLGDIVRSEEAKRSENLVGISTAGGLTYLNMEKHRSGVNLQDDRIKEGLRLSLLAITETGQHAALSDIKLLFVILPTKVNVYSSVIQNSNMASKELILGMLKNEETIRNRLSRHFEKHGLPFIDMLAALTTEAEVSDIYPLNDSHPNAKGYAVIAKSISDNLPLLPE